jgi:hypothetical protein
LARRGVRVYPCPLGRGVISGQRRAAALNFITTLRDGGFAVIGSTTLTVARSRHRVSSALMSGCNTQLGMERPIKGSPDTPTEIPHLDFLAQKDYGRERATAAKDGATVKGAPRPSQGLGTDQHRDHLQAGRSKPGSYRDGPPVGNPRRLLPAAAGGEERVGADRAGPEKRQTPRPAAIGSRGVARKLFMGPGGWRRHDGPL